jgi:hypothetical protein
MLQANIPCCPTECEFEAAGHAELALANRYQDRFERELRTRTPCDSPASRCFLAESVRQSLGWECIPRIRPAGGSAKVFDEVARHPGR